MPHSATDVTVSFTGSSMEDINNESWGIDNFSCVPYSGSSPAASSLHITAWEADPDNGLLEGFTAGNPMSFKIYAAVYDYMMELIPEVTLLVGDENFGTGQFTVVQLAAISGVDPIIRMDQASMVFPAIVVNETAVDTVYIYNDGLSALEVSNAATETGFFSVGQSSFTIASESSFALPVFFAPMFLLGSCPARGRRLLWEGAFSGPQGRLGGHVSSHSHCGWSRKNIYIYIYMWDVPK